MRRGSGRPVNIIVGLSVLAAPLPRCYASASIIERVFWAAHVSKVEIRVEILRLHLPFRATVAGGAVTSTSHAAFRCSLGHSPGGQRFQTWLARPGRRGGRLVASGLGPGVGFAHR